MLKEFEHFTPSRRRPSLGVCSSSASIIKGYGLHKLQQISTQKQCPCPESCSLTSARAQEKNHGLGGICLRPSFLGMGLQMLSSSSESVTLAYGQVCMCNSTRCPFVCEQPRELLSLHTGLFPAEQALPALSGNSAPQGCR